MVTMMRRMARLAPRVLFPPVSEVQTRTLTTTTTFPLLVSPSPVWSGQQSLRRLLQPPAAPGFVRLEEKTALTSVLRRPEIARNSILGLLGLPWIRQVGMRRPLTFLFIELV